MIITKKIIVTDTNIITDLNTAGILDKFVSLDNVYISDIVKNDEIKTSTGNVKVISKFKTLCFSSEQLLEMLELAQNNKKLSECDLINFILARDNDGLLATGDRRLVMFSEERNVEIIRTLKIIELMYKEKVINAKEAIKACTLLSEDKPTRIPKDDINKLIKNLENDSVVC